MKTIAAIFATVLCLATISCSKEPDITTGSSKKTAATTATIAVTDSINSNLNP